MALGAVFFTVCAACLLPISFAADIALDTRVSITEMKDYILVCIQDPVDMAFIVDASSSIWPRNFTLGLEFIVDFLDMYEIGPDKVRIAAVTYGRGAYYTDAFSFSRYNTKEDVSRAIAALPYRAGDATETWKALDYMRTKQMVEARPDVPHVAIVMTDGRSQIPWKTKEAAQTARDAGIKIFAIGIGSQVQQTELVNIAGTPENVFQVGGYDKLKEIKERLAFQACEKKERPTTPPKAPTCGEATPSDVYFVLDKARLGPDGTGFATSVASHVVQAEDMLQGMQYGLLGLLCPEGEGFPLQGFQTTQQPVALLHNYDSDVLPQLVQRAAAKLTSSKDGARPAVRRVMVVFLGGKMDRAQVLEAVEAARRSDIQLFFADAGGSDPGLLGELAKHGTVLGPGSSRQQAELLLSALCPNNFGL